VLDAEYFFQLTEYLLSENHPEVLRVYDEVVTKGFDAEVFINGLAEHMRNLLVCKDARSAALLEASEGLAQRYAQQASLAANAFLLSALSLLNECEINLRQARNRRLHTELYLLKISYIGSALDWSQRSASSESVSEKKKPEPVAAIAKASPTPVAVNVQQVSEPQAPTISTPRAEQAPQSEIASRSTLRKPDGQVRLSLDAFDQAVQLETVLNSEKISRFEEPAILECWQDYASSSDSAILRSNMQAAELQIDLASKSIKVLTHNGVARDMILQEKTLLDRLRSQLHEPLMRLTVEIDAAAAEAAKPKAPTRAMSEHEKFVQMAQVNPALEQLRTIFDLKIVE
jgi:DNA polymerase III subunit gamma/tau